MLGAEALGEQGQAAPRWEYMPSGPLPDQQQGDWGRGKAAPSRASHSLPASTASAPGLRAQRALLAFFPWRASCSGASPAGAPPCWELSGCSEVRAEVANSGFRGLQTLGLWLHSRHRPGGFRRGRGQVGLCWGHVQSAGCQSGRRTWGSLIWSELGLRSGSQEEAARGPPRMQDRTAETLSRGSQVAKF